MIIDIDVMLKCVAVVPGDAAWQRLRLTDQTDFGQIRFMESYESGHTDHTFTARLAQALNITKPPLRLDSQAKYGEADVTFGWHDGKLCTSCK